MPLEVKMFVFVEYVLKLLVLSQENEKSFFKGSNRFAGFLQHPAHGPRTGKQWWWKGEISANLEAFVLLPTPCVILPGNLPTMADSWLASSIAEVREPYYLVWQCYETWASRNHQVLITCAWVPSASPRLPIPARESSLGHHEQREESYWLLTIYLLWLSEMLFGHPKSEEEKACSWGHLSFCVIERNMSKYVNCRYQVP